MEKQSKIIGTTVFEGENLEFLNFIYTLFESKGYKMRDFSNEGNFNFKTDMTKRWFDMPNNGFQSGCIFYKELVEYAVDKEVLFLKSNIKNHTDMTQFEYLNIYVFNTMYDVMTWFSYMNPETKCFNVQTINKFYKKTGVKFFPEKSSNTKIIVLDGLERTIKIKKLLDIN